MAIAIKAENISKQYRLGYVGSGSLKDDARRWWARMRGKEDPLLTVGETNDRSTKGESDYVWALKDINFEIEQGDTVGIIGRNGAGKSTLLKILSKVTAPTTGNIKVKGRIASLLEVGTGFHGELTGRENIYLNGAIMGMRKHEITRKLDEIVDFAGVERYLDTPVKRYSSGMYVRLGFAVAAHLENEILIVDEVLAVGDAEFQKKCLDKINYVSTKEGKTVIFVSHNNSNISQICNAGIYLKNGMVFTSGDASFCLKEYVNDERHTNGNSLAECYNSEKPSITSFVMEKDDIKDGKFTFKFDYNSPFELNTPSIGLLIKDYLGRPVVGTNNRIHSRNIKRHVSKSGKMKLEINGLFLMPGDYTISLFIGDAYKDFMQYENIYSFTYINPLAGNSILPDIKTIGAVFLGDVSWQYQN